VQPVNAIEQITPYSTVKQPAAQSRVKCQGRTIQKKQNTSVRLCTLYIYPGVGYLRCCGE
jgi:hypothetical protein